MAQHSSSFNTAMIHGSTDTSLVSSVSKDLLAPAFDLATDYSEIPIDAFVDNDILKEIPIVKSIVGIAKTGLMIRERYFAKKLLTFLQEYHRSQVTQLKLDEFKLRFAEDEKFKQRVIDHIIILNDRFLEVEKAKILARLFASYVGGSYSWEHFASLSSVLDAIHPKAFTHLDLLANHGFKLDGKERIGTFEDEALLYSCGIAYTTSAFSSNFNISELGKDLYSYGLKNTTS